jgi:hypothetical protein
VHSNHLEKLLGWKARGGSKYLQKVSIPKWIREKEEYKINCLKGLIETDGAIYKDRGYEMVIFSTIIAKLAEETYDIFKSLGFNPKLYSIKQQPTGKLKHQVRLSVDVHEFLNKVKPDKS